MAWNVPLFLAINKLGPALLAGCTVVLKPAGETPLSANALAEVFADAGLPEGVLSVVPGGIETGQGFGRHECLHHVTVDALLAANLKFTLRHALGVFLGAVNQQLFCKRIGPPLTGTGRQKDEAVAKPRGAVNVVGVAGVDPEM